MQYFVRGLYGQVFNYSKPKIPVFPKVVLEDRRVGKRAQLLSLFSSALFSPTRVLQKLHPQRSLAYPLLCSKVQPGWALVLSRYRLFKGREFKQHHHQAHQAQSCGNDCGGFGPEALHSLSHPTCTAVPARKATTGKDRQCLCLYGCRPSYSQGSAPGSGHSKPACSTCTSGNSGVGLRGVHSKSPSQFRAVSQDTQIQQAYKHHCKTGRKGLHPVWGKKNSANCGAEALWALKLSLERLNQEVAPAALFPTAPVIHFMPEVERCCGQDLLVQKTRKKTLWTMNGPFVAHETLGKCSQCSQIYGSGSLLNLAPKGSRVAFDVLVFVGRALFQRHLNIKEVQIELMARNVRICTSEIDYLGRKFITYLAFAHRRSTPRIRHKIEMAGGYVLHLDATHEGDAPALMSGMDSLSEFVLANVKIPSENADHIIPFLQEIEADYGTPVACVHDMGTGICKAVSEVFPDTKDFICHFHFLRDIGKDFLEPAYGQLRKRLRKHSTSTGLHYLVRQMKQTLQEQGLEGLYLTKSLKDGKMPEDTSLLPLVSAYSLALWALHGKQTGKGYGFPFDRPLLNFAERVLELNQSMPELLKLLPKDKTRRPFRKLAKQLSQIGHDQELFRAVKELRWRVEIFDDLRTAMRIAPENENNGLNDDGSQASMTTIRQEVENFREKLRNDSKLAKDGLCQNIAKQIDKYSEKIFADPIEVNTPKGKVSIYPQRTNNIMEQFFRSLRRAQRRKTGNNSLRQMLYTMLAETPLIKNLDNPEYMEVLLDGKSSLEGLFASLDRESGFANKEATKRSERILPGFRYVMKIKNLPEQIIELFAKTKLVTESN